MFPLDALLALDTKNTLDIEAFASALPTEDLGALSELLGESDDKVRYPAFLCALARASETPDLYPYTETHCAKIVSPESYQRMIGLRMTAANARLDSENIINAHIGDFLSCLRDPKPIAIRTCIQALGNVAAYKPELRSRIFSAFSALDPFEISENMRSLVLLDILGVLALYPQEENVGAYVESILNGKALDERNRKKAVKLLGLTR